MGRHAHSTEGGFTLIEMLIAISISALIFGVIGGAMILGFQTTGSSETVLNQSHDEQLLATRLPADAQSSDPGGADTASGTSWGCGGTPLPTSINILRLASTDLSTGVTSFASYRWDSTVPQELT